MIINPQIKEQLQQLAHSPQGNALKIYLEQFKEETNNIKTLESWEEVLGRKFAIKCVEDLFSFMDDKKIEVKSKNQYI